MHVEVRSKFFHTFPSSVSLVTVLIKPRLHVSWPRISLSDRYVLLLQEEIEESSSLCTRVAGRAEQNNQLESKLTWFYSTTVHD